MTRFNSGLAKTIFESNVEMNAHAYNVEANWNHTVYKVASKDCSLVAILTLSISDFCLDIRKDEKMIVSVIKTYEDTTVGGFARVIYDAMHIIEAYDSFYGLQIA